MVGSREDSFDRKKWQAVPAGLFLGLTDPLTCAKFVRKN